MEFKYSLDRTSKKFICPECEKKRFVRYVNNETKEYLNSKVGLCDRANNCNYHFTPKAFFESNGRNDFIPKEWSSIRKSHNRISVKNTSNRISNEDVEASLTNYDQNDFTLFLYDIFGDDLANQLIEKYFLGTYNKWGRGASVFWQIDEKGEVRTGKVMAYNRHTGSRQKLNDKPLITWFHSEQKHIGLIKDFQLQQCQYGEHLLQTESKDKSIGIVESEKTAIIMTAIWPEIIWMACGGLSQIKKETFYPLFGREIRLFPDLNGFEKWKVKMEILKELGYEISIDDFLEKNVCEEDKKEGYDLADFFLKRDFSFGWALTEENYPLFWDR